jgi:hypothetical protein
MPANNYDADYFTDMAAVEAQERKRQREQDGPEEIDPEVLAEWAEWDDEYIIEDDAYYEEE